MLRAILATTASQAVLLLLQMTAIVVTAHFLGPEGRGAYGVVVTWALLIASCASFSLDSAMPKRASAAETDWLASLFAATVRLWVWLSLFGLLGALALYVIFGQTLFAGVEPLALLLGLLALPVLIWSRYQTSLLLAAGFLGLRNRNQIVGALASTLGVIILVVVIPGSVLGGTGGFFDQRCFAGRYRLCPADAARRTKLVA